MKKNGIRSKHRQLKGAAYTAQCEQALMQGLDDEFEDELEL